jgi:hypothetical protein
LNFFQKFTALIFIHVVELVAFLKFFNRIAFIAKRLEAIVEVISESSQFLFRPVGNFSKRDHGRFPLIKLNYQKERIMAIVFLLNLHKKGPRCTVAKVCSKKQDY